MSAAAAKISTTVRSTLKMAGLRASFLLGSWFDARATVRRAGDLFGALWSNDDREGYRLAQGVLEGRYAFLEEGIADPSGDGPTVA